MSSQLTYRQRVEAHTLRTHVGWTHARIANALEIPRTTITTLLQEPATPRKRTGRPIKIRTPERLRLVNFISESSVNRRMSYAELGLHLNLDASEKAIRTALDLEGFHRRIAREKPFLSSAAKIKRLEWAMKYSHWTVQDWKKIFFTDECAMNVGGTAGNVWVTRKAGEEFTETCIRPKFRKFSLCMVWAGISGYGKSPIIFWDKKKWGNITAKGYTTHIVPHAQGYLAAHPDTMMMEDNAPVHKARHTQAHMELVGITVFGWPPSSPDMNPIENLWQILKQRIAARQVRTEAEMRQAVQEEWDNIEFSEIMKLVETMPHRVADLIAVMGGCTRW
jgi:transposase